MRTSQKNGKSVLDWCPFAGGDSIDEIVKNHNRKLLEKTKELSDLKKYCREGIIVDSCDLSRIDKLEYEDLMKVKILLIDLEAFDEKKKVNETELSHLKERLELAVMAELTNLKYRGLEKEITVKKYLIAQVSQKSNTTSQLSFFESLPYDPSHPEILRAQEELSLFLDFFSRLYYIPLKSTDWKKEATLAELSPSAEVEFSKAIPRISAEVRDVSYQKGYNDSQIEALAKNAAIQEAVLIDIAEKISPPSEGQIVLDFLRQPLNQIPVEPSMLEPQMQEVQLVKLTWDPLWRDLTENQSTILMNLGLMQDATASVHLNEPRLWEDVQKLGNTIQTEKFTAKLPRWEA